MSDADDEQYPLNIICPVCGYYCLGNGGVGCIDKPWIVNHAGISGVLVRDGYWDERIEFGANGTIYQTVHAFAWPVRRMFKLIYGAERRIS